MEPYGTWTLNTPQVVRLMLFVVEGAFISLISARLRSARQRAESNAAEGGVLAGRLLPPSEAEQRRIGHDLHDGLGQHLTGIALMVRRLEQRLSAAGSADAGDAQKLAELARTAVEWTHDLCRSLSPAALDEGGLEEGLRELAARAENLFNITCTFERHGGPAPVDVDTAAHVYRIAQEAISNGVRHGGARHVRIEMIAGRANPGGNGSGNGSYGGGDVTVKICDDGSGIAPPIAAGAEGMGLRIMRYRARMIGATLDVTPGDNGRGTVVTCRCPTQAAPRSAAASPAATENYEQ
jgi:signal transduction histidine kinase